MRRYLINRDWRLAEGMVYSIALAGETKPIDLPYDIMIHEKRREDTKNSIQTGFYPGGTYTCLKSLEIPADWRGDIVKLFFEGVYGNARVFLNGNFAGACPYGYSGFTVEANDFLNQDGKNEVSVLIDAAEQGTRWYSGSGIYRNVWLLRGGRVCIPEQGIRVSTPEVEAEVAVALVEIPVENRDVIPHSFLAEISILDARGGLVGRETMKATVYPGKGQCLRQRMTIDTPRLWSPDTPELYGCRVSLLEEGKVIDEEETDFGVRRLQLDRKYGLRINGVPTKLRGTCIHHDNGILGAAAFPGAEERKVRLLKEAGFNCIRSAHNPCSAALLEACDRIGMLVMDELSDVWTMPKNVHDYSQYFYWHWKEAVRDMVRKDFNHPSVILYSMGNELQEAGRPRGGALNREVNAFFKELDSSRYTTNAANGTAATMFTNLEEMVEEVRRRQQMAEDAAHGREAGQTMGAEPEPSGSEEAAEGSARLNMIMAAQAGPIADEVVCHPKMEAALTEFESAMDIAGYNYMTTLHGPDGQRHPNRLVLATETYPAEVARVWDSVLKYPHVLGEMTWTGYDYLGEAGCGIFRYDGTMNFAPRFPDSLAYIGDIDITGYRRPVSYYREIVYGLRKEPYIAVQRPEHYHETYTPSPWLFSDTLASWTWPGYEGKPVKVEVYSPDREIALYLDGRLLGRRALGEEKPFLATFDVIYQPGRLTAVGFQGGQETGRSELVTAGREVRVSVTADRESLGRDELALVTIELTDETGNRQLTAVRELTMTVTGAGRLEAFGSADPRTNSHYQDSTWLTYDGRLLAAVRSEEDTGEIRIVVSGAGVEMVEQCILVEECQGTNRASSTFPGSFEA